MELFSWRRWRLASAQLSNKFSYCPLCTVALFCKVINKTAYHLGCYEPSSLVSCHTPRICPWVPTSKACECQDFESSKLYLWITIIVTRFGENSPLWRKIESIWVTLLIAFLVFGKLLYQLWHFLLRGKLSLLYMATDWIVI